MKAPLTFKDRYPITTLIVSAVVAVLIHFPEVLSLSDSFERQELFAGMEPQDVINEILFTFISLLLLFWINMRIFRFNTPMVRVTKTKMALSFFLTWAASSLFGQLFVLLHHQFDIPAIDAMVHHYLHPLRDTHNRQHRHRYQLHIPSRSQAAAHHRRERGTAYGERAAPIRVAQEPAEPPHAVQFA